MYPLASLWDARSLILANIAIDPGMGIEFRWKHVSI